MNKVDASELGEVFVKVREVEPALRRMIKADLNRSLGPLWRSHLPESLLEELQLRRDKDKDRRGRSRGPELLEYTSISELTDLILRFWDGIFENRFGGREFTQGQLDEFRVLRNMLMHSSPMASQECERISVLADEIVRVCDKSVVLPSDRAQQVEGGAAQASGLAGREADHGRGAMVQAIDFALKAMSGLITGERRALLAFLQNHLDQCSYPMLERVRQKFATMPDTEALVDDLIRDLPPRRPGAPREDWSTSKWLRWATREYLPYRGWLNRTSRRDLELDEYAAKYEKWLVVTYPQLLREGHDCLVENVHRQVKGRLGAGKGVFWLVVDNLSGFWLADFEEALEGAGFRIEDYRRMLAMIPSTSAVSRRSMLAGRPPVHAMEFSNDASASDQLWKEQGVAFRAFCTDFDAAKVAVENGNELVVLVHSRLDDLAHDPEKGGFDREEEMRGVMESLAVKVGGLVRAMNNVRPTKLVVSTDHGSIWAAKDSRVISLPPSLSNQEDIERHRRYCAVNDAGGLNELEWHVLTPELYGLPETYAVAQGLSFIDALPRGYTHGGLTPEETAVAMLVCSPSEQEGLRLGFRSYGKELRLGRPGKLSVLVRNPFDMRLEDLEIRLPDFKIEFDRMDLEAVSEAITNEVEISLRAETEAKDDVAYLRLEYEYTIAASRQVETGYLKVGVARLYRSTMEDLQDVFDD